MGHCQKKTTLVTTQLRQGKARWKDWQCFEVHNVNMCLPQDDKKSFHREEFGLVGDFKGGHFLHFLAPLHLGWLVSVDETVGVKISLSNWLE